MKFSALLLLLCLTPNVRRLTPGSPAVELSAEPHHHLIFSNDQVRVYSVDVPPHAETLLHWHHHDYIAVAFGDTDVLALPQDKPSTEIKLRDAETIFVPAAATPHIARNLAATPFRNITVELLNDEKLHHSAYPWDEDRALHVLHGGTQEILWVKDGVRVTEIELQPGGMIPEHHHSTPHLAISLTDYTLESDE